MNGCYSLVVVSCLIAATPGIPVTMPPATMAPSGPPSCPVVGAADFDQCPQECEMPYLSPTITSAMVSCLRGSVCILYQIGGVYKYSFSPIIATCTTQGWIASNGNQVVDTTTFPSLWACCP